MAIQLVNQPIKADMKGIEISQMLIVKFFANVALIVILKINFEEENICINFAIHFTEAIAQLVRASDCGSEGRGFETH